MKKISRYVGWEIVKSVFFPCVLLVLFIALYIFYKLHISSEITPVFAGRIRRYGTTFFILIIAFIIHKISAAFVEWYKENIAKITKTKLDDKFIMIVRRTIKISIWTLAFLIILPFYGVNINALIAALGVTSLAIALAAQDTIANVIAGFLIMVDAPFRDGDTIKIPSGETVKVLEIGVRRSTFLSKEEAIIILPNLDLSKSKIINYTYGEERKRGERS